MDINFVGDSLKIGFYFYCIAVVNCYCFRALFIVCVKIIGIA